MTPSPYGIYIHIPFCLSRCAYCGFFSTIYKAGAADRYIQALAVEIGTYSNVYADRPPHTLFIGGGTPSCLTDQQLSALLHALPQLDAGGEATVELNPDSTSRSKLDILRRAGINRVSFGAQTFAPRGLFLLERRHTAEAVVEAVALAKQAGFTNINIDLIAAWPGQRVTDVVTDCRTALALETTHISCYMLMADENTLFPKKVAEKGLRFCNDDDTRQAWDAVESTLSAGGMIHYETSNFALPGCECRHNLATWKGGEYLGFGAAAHSHWHGERRANVDSLEGYINALEHGESPVVAREYLDPEAKARETAVMWLRLAEGIDVADFHQRTGIPLAQLYMEELPALLKRGMLEYDVSGKNLRVAPEFRPVLDAILVDLV